MIRLDEFVERKDSSSDHLSGFVVSKTKKNSTTFKDFCCQFSKTFQRPIRAISCRKIASVSNILTQ